MDAERQKTTQENDTPGFGDKADQISQQMQELQRNSLSNLLRDLWQRYMAFMRNIGKQK